jgi:hypothetical protein
MYINEVRITDDLKVHLDNTVIRPYEKITDDIRQFTSQNKKIWVSPMSSFAIFNAVTNQVFSWCFEVYKPVANF